MGEPPPNPLNPDDIDKISGLLDFFSDRAVAHASFFLASLFGLVAFATIVREEITCINSFLYWIGILLFFGFGYAGYFTLIRFGYYAHVSQKIAELGLEQTATLLKIPLNEKDRKERNLKELFDSLTKTQKRILLSKRLGKMDRPLFVFIYWLTVAFIGVLVFPDKEMTFAIISVLALVFCGLLPFLIYKTETTQPKNNSPTSLGK